MKYFIRSLMLLPAFMFVSTGTIAETKYQQGEHYTETGKQMIKNVDSEKVQVIELFSYSCPHCFRLDSQLMEWKKDLPEYVEFIQVPAIFRDSWLQLARVFYAAEQSGDLEMLHPKLFHAIHVDKRRLNSEKELLDFIEEQGLDRDDFEKRMNSFAVQTKVKKALVMSQTSGITGVPAMVVEGRYRTDAPQAGSMEEMIDVVDVLIEKVVKEK